MNHKSGTYEGWRNFVYIYLTCNTYLWNSCNYRTRFRFIGKQILSDSSGNINNDIIISQSCTNKNSKFLPKMSRSKSVKLANSHQQSFIIVKALGTLVKMTHFLSQLLEFLNSVTELFTIFDWRFLPQTSSACGVLTWSVVISPVRCPPGPRPPGHF